MKFLIFILWISFSAIICSKKSNEIRRLSIDRTEESEDQEQPNPKLEHRPCGECRQPVCKEKCKCLPDVVTKAFTPTRELKITENTILVCSHQSTIKRLELIDDQYNYNLTCNGIIARKDKSADDFMTAVFEEGDHDQTRSKERREVLALKDKYSISHFNQGSESYWNRGIIANGQCAGDTLISYGHWIANDPLYGCCGEGVNLWTSVYYRIEVLGKCCSTCYLFQSAYTSQQVLRN